MKLEITDKMLEAYAGIVNDPFEFLKAINTKDEVDPKQTTKPFPWDIKYIELYTRLWMKRRLLAIPKSRRMKMTWTNLALYTWLTAFHKGKLNGIVSKKEEDSDDLIRRCKYILEHPIEARLPKELIPKFEYKFNHLYFPEMESTLQGFPSGSDQLRQFTFSGLMFDEMAFWDKAEDAYSAAYPTIEGGGKMTLISSPGPGFFKNIVFDALDDGEFTGHEPQATEDTKRDVKYPIPGVEIWTNPKNKFTVFQLHYSADPSKKGNEEWLKQVKRGMPRRRFMQEYELAWESWAGKPVYADWNKAVHGVEREIKPHLGLPLLRGWDFGITPACVVVQLQGSTLCVLQEFTSFNEGLETFSDKVLRACKLKWPAWGDPRTDWVDYYDPSGNRKAESNAVSCANVLKKKNLRAFPSAITFEERRSAVEYFLTRRTKDGQCFQLALPTCPIIARGFNGGYRYPDSKDLAEFEVNKIKPLKDEHSHIHDALQYVASGVQRMHNRRKRSIPIPYYSWVGTRHA